ncbi:hypothetical protein LCGC14_2710170 [marine sediment metagenome]|uniref:Uncharacterized protein n=1 Tax=marine sediment metagenome TaxID=412755 RepID=A0A0F9BM58_9ZZZZ
MRSTYVPPSGPPNATLAACGEQPGVYEIRNKPFPKPFVGPATCPGGRFFSPIWPRAFWWGFHR